MKLLLNSYILKKIAEIRRLIGTRQAEIKPRKKFSFTSKTKLNKNPCIGRENVSEKNSSGTLLDTMAESTNCISNKRNEYCKLDSNYLKQNHLDCLITNCQYSVIDLRDKSLVLSSVNIEKCVNCVLILGSISGSLHIAGVENSVIIGKIQQFRMHCSKSCICAIQSDSNPIIEDCSKIGFCELCHFEWLDHSNGQQKQQSLGQMIKDFNWLQDTQSPNWYILGTQDIDLLSEILCNPLKSGTCDKTLFDRLINSVISSR